MIVISGHELLQV